VASEKLREENVSGERDADDESSKIRTKISHGFGSIEVISDLDRHKFRGLVRQTSWIGEGKSDLLVKYWRCIQR
jgi:hypothetical protein